jgi:rubrerythrin
LTSPNVRDTDNELEAYIADMAKNHVFSDLKDLNARLSEAKTVSDAIQLALQCEKDSVIFYLSMLEATCEGKARDFVDLLIKEEQSHVKRLSIQLRKCSADARECLLNWPA